jgi:hypothetical protein
MRDEAYGGDHEHCCLLECDAVWYCICSLTFRRHLLLPSSGSKTSYTGLHGVTSHKTVSSGLTFKISLNELTQEHFRSRHQTQWPTRISFWWRYKRVYSLRKIQEAGRVSQYCHREQVHTQVFVAVNSAMFAPWRRVKGKLRTSLVGSLDYVMLYSPKLLPRLTNFWPTIILSCCVRSSCQKWQREKKQLLSTNREESFKG